MRRTPLTLILFALPLAACATGDADPPARSRGPAATTPGTPASDPGGASTPTDPGARGTDPATTPPAPRDPSANPPAVSGGTMALTDANHTAIVADPDRDHVYIVDLVTRAVRRDIALTPGDEPGRVAVDTNGYVHVVLRNAGAVATIEPNLGAVLARRAVCPAPRGLAFVAARRELVVACQGGELVGLPPAPLLPVSWTRRLDSDLRDVVVDGGTVYVTRFRAPEVLRLDEGNAIVERIRPAVPAVPGTFEPPDPTTPAAQSPAIAWRTRALPGGGWLMSHQVGKNAPLDTLQTAMVATGQGGGYGGGGGATECVPGAVEFGMTVTRASQVQTSAACQFDVPLPVDITPSPDGSRIAVVSAVSPQDMPPTAGRDPTGLLVTGPIAVFDRATGAACVPTFLRLPMNAQVTSAEFVDATTLAVFAREPAALLLVDVTARAGSDATRATIPLSTQSRMDTGHAIFHARTGAGLACASCHPEGGDDGRTWRFLFASMPAAERATGAPRRTPSLFGHLMDTAPFHWDGDMHDLTQLTTEVFTHRMGGAQLDASQVTALARWLDTVDAPPPMAVDHDAAERGHALFDDGTVGCRGCHTGAKFTSNASVDVGTGGVFQVPSLVGVHTRGPWLHDGCAATLSDRFTNPACGGGDHHGHTSQLTPAQVSDLVAFLQTL